MPDEKKMKFVVPEAEMARTVETIGNQNFLDTTRHVVQVGRCIFLTAKNMLVCLLHRVVQVNKV